jgi:signal peptidase I
VTADERHAVSVDATGSHVSTDAGSEAVAPAARGWGRSPGRHRAAVEQRRSGSFLRELPFLLVVALGLALLIKAFLVQAFYIPSGSMENTLKIKDRVLVNKLVYRFRDIHRGEIVVFNGLDSFTPEVRVVQPTNPVVRGLQAVARGVGAAPPGEEDFIKRVIGIPGDTVQCCDAQGRVQVNGVALDEKSYLYEDNHDKFGPVKVPTGRLWVMGDHRQFSADSRAHLTDPGGGTVPANKVIGRAFVKVWPLTRVGVLSVPATFHARALSYAPVAAPYALGLIGALPPTLLRRRRRVRAA